MRVASFIVFFLVIGFEVFSQQFHYSLRNYKAIDGLPQSQVRGILEDKNGYLWIGTEGGGLARFDGHSFRVYTTLDGLQSNIVYSLQIDAEENLWIVHPRGLTKFDGSSFKRFEQPGDPQNTIRLRRMFELGDTLFFLSAPGYIGKIFNDSVYYWSKPIFPDKKGEVPSLINFVRQGPDGELLFCIDSKSFYCRRGNENFMVPFNEEFKDIKSTFIYLGKLWMQTDKGFRSVDLKTRTINKETLPVTNTILFYDKFGDIFWTIKGNDFLKEKIKDGKMKVDTVLRDVEVGNVLPDSEGNTWFGTNGNGLFRYFIQDFDRCGSPNMAGVMAIYHDSRGATWVGTMTKGLYRIKKGKVKNFSDSEDIMKNSVYSIAETTDGKLYIAGLAGIAEYDEATDSFAWERISVDNWKATVFSIQLTPSGAMWLAVPGGGIFFRDGGKEKIYNQKDGMLSTFVMSMHYSKYYNRLFYGDEFGIGSVADGKVSNLKTVISNTSVISIQPYRDSLLLLSTAGAGFVIYNPGSGESKVVTTKDGLPSDFIYFSAADQNDDLWVGSEKGITRVKMNADLEMAEHLHYDFENGLTGVETNQNAFCFFDDNKIFGLIDGLYQFNDPPQEGRSNFPLHLTDVKVFFGETSLKDFASGADGFFDIPTNLSLPPDKNHITFKFNKVDKRARKSMKFKYLLQGFDKKWSQPSSNPEVTYSNLPPGEYTFLVLSTDAKGGWSGRPLRYDFEIQSPFYAKTGFVISMILLAAALIALILYMRVRQRVRHVVMLQKIRLKEQETVRKDIARDFHDEMGNQLSRIINYVSLLKLNGHNGTSHNQDLYTKVEDSAKYLYSGTRDFIWSIDPGNDELSKLFIHIRDFGEKLLEEKQIKFRAFNLVKEKIKLPYGFSREANLIFKEAMTNAFKYSKAENVTLSLKPLSDGFELCLEDDGIGFSKECTAEKEGGLKNIRERAERINVTLHVESILGQGTKIYIHFIKTKTMHYGLTF
jgi:signal transduction histidine kinase